VLGAIVATILFVGVAYADNVQNDVVAGGNDTIVAGNSTTINYRIAQNNGDGQSGCNAADLTPATVTINTPAGVTATPSSLSFTSCGTDKSGSFTSSTPGDYAITVSVSDSGTGTYNVSPARFTLHVTAPTDTTAPVITPNISGTLGNNGWYTSDVIVTWSVTDPESSAITSTGCGTTTIDSDTPGTTLTCTAASAGGANSQSVTIKRDATAPTITSSRTPANSNGWNNGPVGVNFLCADSGSGIFSCTSSGTFVGGGANQSITGTATDQAGNTASVTVSDINIDTTAPTITATRTPAANANGWNNSSVTVHYTCSDALSGIDSCPSDEVLMGEGAGQSASGTATDMAGNSAGVTVNDINIDKTSPTASGSASPAANSNGWNNTDVTVSFDGTDALSGIDFCDDPVGLSTEGNHAVSGVCSDKAGNVSVPSDPVSVKIDKTAPTVSLVGGPADGGSYYFGSVPAAPTCSASDALSGLDGSCSVNGYSTALGIHTVVASATDKAGNVNGASATYTVLAWNLHGFYQPVDMGGVVNTVKAGATVPFKFEVFAASELTDTAVVQSFVPTKINCTSFNGDPADEIEFTATGGTSLRYDSTGGQFINNWKTPSQPGTCWRVTMTTDDGSSLAAFFKLK
jgi:hypothetical protein